MPGFISSASHHDDCVGRWRHTCAAPVRIEVKSGRRRESLAGMQEFGRRFQPKRKLLVGGQGIPIEEFLLRPAEYWLR